MTITPEDRALIELKPCPFCGGRAEIKEGHHTKYAMCLKCADAGPSPRSHFLKTWPEYFNAIVSGEKRFELRKNDRDYRVGDRLELAEFDPGLDGGFTGREHDVDVTYVLHGGAFGLPTGYVVMSIESVPDGGEAVHSQPSDQAPAEPSSSKDKTNAG